jgi:hypothetical protein
MFENAYPMAGADEARASRPVRRSDKSRPLKRFGSGVAATITAEAGSIGPPA